MPPSPYIEPLSRRKRQIIFILTVCLFMVVVPLLVFYSIGYRFDFASTEQNIRTVGGLYISTDTDEAQIYVDDEPVEDMRVFQQAAYVQNVTEGMHQVHVQGVGLNTWVKDLPVLAHYVTEAKSFNFPVTPQLRVITEWTTNTGASVLFEPVASTSFATASTSNVFLVATSTATSSYTENSEFTFIESRFASSSQEQRAREAIALREERPFMFSSEVPNVASGTVATTTTYDQDMVLYEQADEVYVSWRGNTNSIPYYFCVQSEDPASIARWYGEHVAASFLRAEHASSSVATFSKGLQQCRGTIKIDRQWETVTWFDFHPSIPGVILLQSDTGLYAVEIDDRAWQNRQLMYEGESFEAIISGSSVYIEDGAYTFELLPELISG